MIDVIHHQIETQIVDAGIWYPLLDILMLICLLQGLASPEMKHFNKIRVAPFQLNYQDEIEEVFLRQVLIEEWRIIQPDLAIMRQNLDHLAPGMIGMSAIVNATTSRYLQSATPASMTVTCRRIIKTIIRRDQETTMVVEHMKDHLPP